MTGTEIASLVRTLKSCGVTHYKTAELELTFESPIPPVSAPLPVVGVLPVSHTQAPAFGAALETKIEEDKQAVHKIIETTSLMKLSDTDLIDRLFPDTESVAQ